jgi:hypothetical protein
VTSKRLRSLDASKKRSVTTGVSADEHAAVRAYCDTHGTTVSGLMHQVIEAASVESGPAAPAATKYLAGWLDVEEIETIAALAQAAGMEPVAWLRVMTLARANVGSGAVLVRQLKALGILGRMVSRTKPTAEELASAKADAQRKRVEAGLPAVDPDDLDWQKRLEDGKKWRAEQAKAARKKGKP